MRFLILLIVFCSFSIVLAQEDSGTIMYEQSFRILDLDTISFSFGFSSIYITDKIRQTETTLMLPFRVYPHTTHLNCNNLNLTRYPLGFETSKGVEGYSLDVGEKYTKFYTKIGPAREIEFRCILTGIIREAQEDKLIVSEGENHVFLISPLIRTVREEHADTFYMEVSVSEGYEIMNVSPKYRGITQTSNLVQWGFKPSQLPFLAVLNVEFREIVETDEEESWWSKELVIGDIRSAIISSIVVGILGAFWKREFLWKHIKKFIGFFMKGENE